MLRDVHLQRVHIDVDELVSLHVAHIFPSAKSKRHHLHHHHVGNVASDEPRLSRAILCDELKLSADQIFLSVFFAFSDVVSQFCERLLSQLQVHFVLSLCNSSSSIYFAITALAQSLHHIAFHIATQGQSHHIGAAAAVSHGHHLSPSSWPQRNPIA